MPRLESKVHRATVPQANQFKATALPSRTTATALLNKTLATVLPSRPMATVFLSQAKATVLLSPARATVLLSKVSATVIMLFREGTATVLPRGEAPPLSGVRDTLLPKGNRSMVLPDMVATVVEPLATVATTAPKADMAAQESGKHDVHGIKLSV